MLARGCDPGWAVRGNEGLVRTLLKLQVLPVEDVEHVRVAGGGCSLLAGGRLGLAVPESCQVLGLPELRFAGAGGRVDHELGLARLDEGAALGLRQLRRFGQRGAFVEWVVRERLAGLVVAEGGLGRCSQSGARLRLRALKRILLAPRLRQVLHHLSVSGMRSGDQLLLTLVNLFSWVEEGGLSNIWNHLCIPLEAMVVDEQASSLLDLLVDS